MIECILYEATIALGMGIDFRKGLGGSKPWGNCSGSGWRKESVETEGMIHNITEKTVRDLSWATAVKTLVVVLADSWTCEFNCQSQCKKYVSTVMLSCHARIDTSKIRRIQHSRECKNSPQGKPNVRQQAVMDDVTWGKPSVTSIASAAGHYSRDNPGRLTYAAAVILHFVWRPALTLWLWPFDPRIKRVSRNICMWSLMILAASVFEMLSGKTYKRRLLMAWVVSDMALLYVCYFILD